jgi:sugar O-acyltransferase (sialic acid O-acetyltransferase NeuD family)
VKLLVYGSSEFGAVLRDLVADCGHEFAGYVDDVHGHRPDVVGSFEAARKSHPASAHGLVLGVGYKNLAARAKLFQQSRAAGYRFPALVHPGAYVHKSARVGEGAIVMARAIVDRAAVLGDACVLWPGVNVSHDSEIGANTVLSPDAIVCGFVRVGPDSFLGAGCVISDHCTVPGGSFVKAGAVFAK